MTEIALFHHIQGLTPGVLAFAERLREAGHTVHTPDAFEGQTFESIDDGFAYAREAGFDTVRGRALAAADDLPEAVVYAGFSWGVMAAQQLLQTRPGALAGLFYHSFVPPEEFGTWPDGVAAQIHSMDHDPFFVEEGDIDAARPFVESHDEVEMFLYPGNGHLFADSSLSTYDSGATELLLQRSLELVDRVG